MCSAQTEWAKDASPWSGRIIRHEPNDVVQLDTVTRVHIARAKDCIDQDGNLVFDSAITDPNAILC